MNRGEGGFGDPFGEVQDDFNILQLFNDNNVFSPLEINLDNLEQELNPDYGQGSTSDSVESEKQWQRPQIVYEIDNGNVNNFHPSNNPNSTQLSSASSSSQPQQQQPQQQYFLTTELNGNQRIILPTQILDPKMLANSKTNSNANEFCFTTPTSSFQPTPPIPSNWTSPGSTIFQEPVSKKRKTTWPVMKQEIDNNFYSDSNENLNQRQIEFQPFLQMNWTQLYSATQQPVQNLLMSIIIDKGVKYEEYDHAFINQKKNHTNVTVNIQVQQLPVYFRQDNFLKQIIEFKLDFCGIKYEMPTTEIEIRQSERDRKPKSFQSIPIKLYENQLHKINVERLHFSETTQNNQRKNGKPNPDQRYFSFVTKLIAIGIDGTCCLVQAWQSEKIIVRAGNPLQFGRPSSPEDDAMWNKTGSLMHYNGPVAIGTNRCFNNAKLTVDGNIVSTGSISHPSDRRVKENIVTLDRKQAMNRLENVRIVEFSYKPEIAKEWGLDETNRHRVGVIAQELREILPDAVKDNGELLTVDDTRIFYDTVAAAQELLEVTGNLENKIGQVEKIGAKLTRFAKKKNFMGSTLSGFTDVTSLSSESYSNHDRRHSGVITSKFTQVAIVTLIIIMACCLLGMSALYVLDWYNRNYVYKKLILPMEGQESIGNLIEQKYNISWIPPTQPLAPLLTATCGLLSNCPRYCCNGKRNNHWNDEGEVENHTKVNPGIPLNSNVEIELLQNKMIIDQRFCVENSCDPRRGLYTLFIPISPTFPMIPLQVHFRINNGEIVDNCGSFKEFNHQTCSQNTLEYSSLPTSYGMTENNFELSVGEFIQSAYRFRIGYTTESCNMNEDQQGRSFEEYNLVFYRKC